MSLALELWASMRVRKKDWLAPVAFAERLRFDIEMPQPLVWNLAGELKPYLQDGDRLAMLLPGDGGEIGQLLGDYLASVPPRRHGLDILRRNTADPATLDAAAAAGYGLAVISCTPQGLVGLPAGMAALVRHDTEGWRKMLYLNAINKFLSGAPAVDVHIVTQEPD